MSVPHMVVVVTRMSVIKWPDIWDRFFVEHDAARFEENRRFHFCITRLLILDREWRHVEHRARYSRVS